MATYKEIQAHVRSKYGFVPQTCWIAHVKSDYGLTQGVAANRIDVLRRAKPCPDSKRRTIVVALRELGVIPSSIVRRGEQ